MMKAYIESLGLEKELFIDLDVTDEYHKKVGTIIAVDDCDKKGLFLATIVIKSEFLKRYEALLTFEKFPNSGYSIGSIT